MGSNDSKFFKLIKQWLTAEDFVGEKGKRSEELGKRLERLCLHIMQYHPLGREAKEVLMWEDFVDKYQLPITREDWGSDLAAILNTKDYINIQCKNYPGINKIDKEKIDGFINDWNRNEFISQGWLVYNGELTSKALEVIDKENQIRKRKQIKLIHVDEILDEVIEKLQEVNNIEKIEDFWNIIQKDKKLLRTKKQAYDYQIEAVQEAKKHFIDKHKSRGTLIMACGSGKTFTAFSIMKEITKPKELILFLVPSLDLMRQSIMFARLDADFDFNGFAVCSAKDAVRRNKNDNPFVSDAEMPIGRVITTPEEIKNEYHKLKTLDDSKRIIIFGTYQSLDKVMKAQKSEVLKNNLPSFNLIICDEAHKTAKIKNNESKFSSIHDNEKISAEKRMYMTATPKIFTETAKEKSKEYDVELLSMDDVDTFGIQFFKFTFTDGVNKERLSDFRVCVPALWGGQYSEEYQKLKGTQNITLSDYTRLMGVAKILLKKNIHSAISFCRYAIAKKSESSLSLTNFFQDYLKKHEDLKDKIKMIHIDGTMSTATRKVKINQLKNYSSEQCVILSNAKCLTEGVDVPALDAVIFMHPRDSEIDIVQATGRVMRKSKHKAYGRVILPIVGFLSEKQKTDEVEVVLDADEKEYKKIRTILNHLRSPAVKKSLTKNINNVLELGDDWDEKEIEVIVEIDEKKLEKAIANRKKLSNRYKKPNQKTKGQKNNQRAHYGDDIKKEIIRTMKVAYEENIKSGVLKRIGTRSYWNIWMSSYLKGHADRTKTYISNLLAKVENQNSLKKFMDNLKTYLDPDLKPVDVINLLRDSFVTEPIFNTLFPNSLINNPVAKTINNFMKDLELDKAMNEERKNLKSFYEEIEIEVKTIKKESAKQELLRKIYEKYIQVIYPSKAEELGIVYTPIEVIDFILNSVNYLLKKEFKKVSFNSKEVKVLDPFTGVGTFITRLLSKDLNLVDDKHLFVKYNNDIWANEILLLPYYIASTNIQYVFNQRFKIEQNHQKDINTNSYYPFPGIIWNDTFLLHEKQIFINDDNNVRVNKLKQESINVIVGNPPYSVKAIPDKYKFLKSKISKLASKSKAKRTNGVYNSYIMSFIYSIDKIKSSNKNGIIAFITNNGYLYNDSCDSFREYLVNKFYKIFIINLKGRGTNSIRSNESQKEGESIFKGKMVGACLFIGILKVKNNLKNKGIFYVDVFNNLKKEKNLSCESKLQWLKNKGSISKLITNKELIKIKLENGNLFNKKLLWPGNYLNIDKNIFNLKSTGIKFHRTRLATNFSKGNLSINMKREIDACNKYIANNSLKPEFYFAKDLQTRINSWAKTKKILSFNKKFLKYIHVRPFVKKWCYYDEDLIANHYDMKNIYPINQEAENILINFSVNPLAIKTLTSSGFVDIGFNYPRLFILNNKIKECYDENNGNQAKIDLDIAKITSNINVLASKYFTYRKKIKFHKKEKISLEKVNEDLIFNYIYGFLHYKEYLKKFKNNFIGKDSPYICKPKYYNDFIKISKIGKSLLKLHLNYEDVPYKGQGIPYVAQFAKGGWELPDIKKYKVKNMKWRDKKDKRVIIYNDFITLNNIPLRAYDYKVGFKSAIKHVMDGYKAEEKKNSDPNNFAMETMHDAKYILKLLIRIINLSLMSLDLIEQLPNFNTTAWDNTI